MPIDPRISMGVNPLQVQMPDPNQGMNALARALQIKGAMTEGDMNALKMQELQRGVTETNALNDAYKGAFGPDGALDRNKLMSTLATGGLGSKIPALQKTFLETDKATADLSKTNAEKQKLELESGIKKAEHVSSILSLAKDPGSYATIRAVVKNQFGQDLPEQFDPNFISATIAQGQTITQKLAAEHQRLTLAETGRHNRSTEGLTAQGQRITMRGQDLVNQRALDQAAQGKWQYDAERGGLVNMQTGEFKPATQGGQAIGPKDKGLNEGQAKANLFGTRMQEADKVLATMAAAGVKRPGVIKGVAESVGNIAGLGTESMGGALSDAAGSLTNWTQSAEQQQVEQAQRDFINAALRRESGASISPAEFRNANKQYFPQPNDDDATLALKARNRKIATEGILAEVPENKRTKVAPVAPEGSWEGDKERRYQEWKARQGK